MFLRKKHLYDVLISLLGKLCTSEEEMQQAESLLRENPIIDAKALLYIARIQKVIPQVYHNLQKAQDAEYPLIASFLNEALQHTISQKERIDQLFANLELFAAEANAVGCRFMVVKGGCLHGLYPIESFRWLADIDVVVSQDTVWKSIDVFRQLHYRPKRIRLESYPYSVKDKNGTFGIAEMLDLDGKLSSFPFDLHLGGFPGCGDSLLEHQLWNRALPLQIGSQEMLMPCIEDSLLIICSHISRHGYARFKDINDAYVCLKHATPNLDWEYLCQVSYRNSCQAILYGLLTRLEKNYEVDIPVEVLSQLKRNAHGILISKLLFRSGRENPNFHGRRQLFLGRFLQASFLYNYYRDRISFSIGLKEAVSGLYFLFQNGRPYRLWKTRKIQSLRSNRRIVIVPIEVSMDETSWHIECIDLQKVEQFALKSGVSVEWISNDIVVWNAGHPEEMILTPKGIYTQSAYNGDIDEAVLEKIQRVTWDLTVQLNEIGAIQAKRVEARPTAGVSVK